MTTRVKRQTERVSRLPVYEVEEMPVERRLQPGAYFVERDGMKVPFERRRNREAANAPRA